MGGLKMAAYLRGVHQQEFHSHLWSTASWSLKLVPEHTIKDQ